jgi:uncharacterized membrane protein
MSETAMETAGHRSSHGEQREDRQTKSENISEVERWVSLIGGGLLTVLGLKLRHRYPGWIAFTGAGFLAYRGVSGRCPVSGWIRDRLAGQVRAAQPDQEEAVHNAAEASLPAADSPPSTATPKSHSEY